MFSKIASSNIINNVLGNNTIYSICSQNLYSCLLKENQQFNIINETKQPFIGIINDDPIFFSQNISNLLLEYHVYGLLFFHNEAPKALKKEDKYILSKKLNNTIKVFFDQSIQDSWGLAKDTNTAIISYGNKTIRDQEPNKDIVILNFNNNQSINRLYQHIKNSFDSCDIINSWNSYEDIIRKIANYKIAISLDNIYDTITCAACACSVISNIKISNVLPSIYFIDNYNVIIDQIKNLITINNRDNINQTQNLIDQNYNIDNFYQSINNIFSSFRNRVYINEA